MSPRKANPALSRCSGILRFWHKVEFFIPYDLQRQVLDAKDAEWSVRTFSGRHLQHAGTRALWQVEPPTGRKLSSFDVYLGVFDKTELTEVTKRVVHAALTPNEDYDQKERGELEGQTCFARIKVTAQGEPLLDEVSVSTAPWALGRIQQRGLAGLDFDSFQTGCETLKNDLKNFRASRTRSDADATDRPSDKGNDGSPAIMVKTLTAQELLALLDVFYNWAGYRPELADPNAPVIVIRARSVEERAKEVISKAKSGGSSLGAEVDTVPPAFQDLTPKENAAEADDDDEDSISLEESEIDILNSFFAKDIERVIESLEGGATCPALTGYLTPLPDSKRIDLYQPAGRQRIAATLQPRNLNSGHWLGPSHHAMSLMQQFAINSIFEQVQTAGVFSVNGPPGTGKTTLLSDVFAENVTRRARALAAFKSPGEAFHPEAVTVNFKGDKESCKIALLRENIAGFEMVVASSNNAAVENISRDLPKTNSLGNPGSPEEKGWRDERGKAILGYLQQVAHNVAARNGKGKYEKLSADDEPWGLISCALGNQQNRRAFVDRISFDGAKPSEKPPKGFDPELHQSLWTWRDKYQGASYAEARRIFLAADQKVSERIKRLDRYAKLKTELQGQTLMSYTAAAGQRQQQAHQVLMAAQAASKTANDEWELCASQLTSLKSEELLIEKGRPGWWVRLLKRSAYQQYRDDLAANYRAQRGGLHHRLVIEEPRLIARKAEQHAVDVHRQAHQALADRKAEWNSKQASLLKLGENFPKAAIPTLDDLELEHWQIDGLWKDEELNRLRSELFAAALKLHEAWLAEVLKKGGRFGSNVIAICHLLSGKRLQEREHALAVWQSLFMVVPVVSTTFASFANQFRDLGPNSLGWLFIDEAGQAVPQAAVGALWRAKRAVVVGDPLQIEPVFTVPIKLIEALANSSDLLSYADVEPHRVSVQNLADTANQLGTWARSGDSPQWIGSPLRVHRRCVDPMFSIANEIAYEGKMIFFDAIDPKKRLPPEDSLDIGPSAWVHASGMTDSKQSVPMQVDLVHRALVTLYQRTGALPPIYIITPFKRIKEELIRRISKSENWSALATPGGIALPKTAKLLDWCKERIGTVHTFQGKEESIVWMVLGCDETTRGAMDWAASKPNLLNVALTRAKHRFFMIGDVDLWGGLRHFIAARPEILPRITPKEFMRRMSQPVSTNVTTPVKDSMV
jgi:hypothetical protein